MPKGTPTIEGSSGEAVSHFGSIRIKVNGNGQLKMKVYSLDDVRTKTLVPFTLAPAIRVIPTRIVNFLEQRASFELKTTELGEFMRVSRVVLYMKEVYTSYPGN